MAGLSEILEEAIFNDVLGGHCLDPFITSLGRNLPNYLSLGELKKCSSTGVYPLYSTVLC